MNKYVILYWVKLDKDDNGSFNHTVARIPYSLNNTSLHRLEHSFRKSLEAVKVRILFYKLIDEKGEK